MVGINPQKIEGRWRKGIALDFHTTSSVPTGHDAAGHMQFDTIRPEIAELLYQLKYRQNRAAAAGIVEAAANFLRQSRSNFDLMVPVPPSSHRHIQPVLLLANGIGAAIGLPVVNCVAATRHTAQLKSVTDPAQRQALVAGLYTVDPTYTSGRRVLLFDDLFRSGTTMNAITGVLLNEGGARDVCALTITKTRSNH
jgi:competence protein ComFC